MSGAIFALVACFLAGIGARDQMVVAGLTVRLGPRPGLVMAALLSGALASAIAAVAATMMAGEINSHPGRLFIAALGMGLAGLESLVRAPRRKPVEPTRSLFAAALVLLADQVMDPARFVIFAFAISTQEPLPAAVGGTVGGGAALVLGSVFARALIERQHLLRAARRVAGALLMIAAIGVMVWLYEWVLPLIG